MKLVTKRSVDYLEEPDHDLWKEKLLLFKCVFWHLKLSAFIPIIFEKRQDISKAGISKTRQITPKLTKWINGTYYIILCIVKFILQGITG